MICPRCESGAVLAGRCGDCGLQLLAQDRFAHVADDDYRDALVRARGQIDAALSRTAIGHYAAEKIDRAGMAIEEARVRLAELHPGQQFGGRWVRDGVSLSERRVGEIAADWGL